MMSARRYHCGQAILPVLLAFGILGLAAVAIGTVRVIKIDKESLAREDLERLAAAVAGNEVRAGFLSDLGRLPAAGSALSLERELIRGELGTTGAPLPAASAGRAGAVQGWRGPYFVPAPGRAPGTDPWGLPYRVVENAGRIEVSSAGADRVHATPDDLRHDAGRARGSLRVRVQRTSATGLVDVPFSRVRLRIWVSCAEPPCGAFATCEGAACSRQTGPQAAVPGFYTWSGAFVLEPGLLHRGVHLVEAEGTGPLTGYRGAATTEVTSEGQELRIVITPGGG